MSNIVYAILGEVFIVYAKVRPFEEGPPAMP